MKPILTKTGSLPNLPWQERPADCTAPVWRYQENPIISRNPIPGVARIFNSAVIPYEDAFVGVFRGEQVNGIPFIYFGRSADGIHWTFDQEKIQFLDENGEPFQPVYAYDPRLVEVDGTYYVIWCQDAYGAAIGMAKTTDFQTFVRVENPFLPFNRNAVLFPRKIDGKYIAIIHPSVAYDLRSSEAWIEAHKYAAPEEIFNGEIGKINNVRFVVSSEAKVWKGDGCPAGLAVYSTLVLGAHAYATTELEGGGMQHIVKQLGYGDDPLNQRASVGWKATKTAERLSEQYMVRIESCSARYSAKALAN